MFRARQLSYAALASCTTDGDDIAAASAVGSVSFMLDTFSAPSCRPPEEGYGTAALRKAGSQLAGYFPATPMVVRTPGVTPVSSGEITARTPGE